jgi:TolB-like protein
VVYLAVFWLLLQVADVVSKTDLISEDTIRWLILGGVILFPIVLVLSWFFEHPWHERETLSMAGDAVLLMAVTIAASLLAWQQWNKTFNRPVIAVLPFEPTDTQPGTIEMTHHLAERFRMLLATLPEVRVIEVESAWHPSLAAIPMTDKASALGADYLVTGTINQTRLNIRLNVQLFDAKGQFLWSHRFRDRLIDQYHLQNAVMVALWEPLGLTEAELLRVSEILQSCEYPVDRDLIIELAAAGNDLAGPEPMSRAALEQLITDLDQWAEGLNEAGLVHLLRAQARLALLQAVEPVRRPVIQELARQDLEEARFLCPALPAIEKLFLLSTHELQSESLDFDGLIGRHPNDATIFSRLAKIAADQGDEEAANGYRQEACALNPLSERYSCD